MRVDRIVLLTAWLSSLSLAAANPAPEMFRTPKPWDALGIWFDAVHTGKASAKSMAAPIGKLVDALQKVDAPSSGQQTRRVENWSELKRCAASLTTGSACDAQTLSNLIDELRPLVSVWTVRGTRVDFNAVSQNGGSGCPADSLTSVASGDGQSLSVIFSGFTIAQSGSVSCTYVVPVTNTQSAKFLSFSVNDRGFSSLASGSSSQILVNFSAGDTIDNTSSGNGPVQDNFTLNNGGTINLDGGSNSTIQVTEEIDLSATDPSDTVQLDSSDYAISGTSNSASGLAVSFLGVLLLGLFSLAPLAL